MRRFTRGWSRSRHCRRSKRARVCATFIFIHAGWRWQVEDLSDVQSRRHSAEVCGLELLFINSVCICNVKERVATYDRRGPCKRACRRVTGNLVIRRALCVVD
jgi:hypothetical protein